MDSSSQGDSGGFGGLKSLPCNINTSSSFDQQSNLLPDTTGDVDVISTEDLPDSRTPVPSLNLFSSNNSTSTATAATSSPPKERKRFTFSFLGDKNKDKDKASSSVIMGSSPSGSASSQHSEQQQQQVTKSDSNELGNLISSIIFIDLDGFVCLDFSFLY